MNPKRIHLFNDGERKSGPVVYWMSRDQRAKDNWALLYAQELARERKSPLAVMFCLVPDFLGASIRQYGFMLKGLEELKKILAGKNIAFLLLPGDPKLEIPRFVTKHNVGILVTDFDPLRIKREWKNSVSERIGIPVYEVDAHNIVPCRIASPKREFGAYTLRPKLHKALPEFLEDFPKLQKHPFPWPIRSESSDWKDGTVSQAVPEMDWLKPGEKAARKVLDLFLESHLANYDSQHNDPTKDAESNLSPYLHFGQISAQRVALEVTRAPLPMAAKEGFLEQLIVRRELADNFCYYNPDYDRFEGFPQWARQSLDAHRKDKREYLYTQDELEFSRTHDDLWNAAQLQMVRTGKMHNFLRMYWAKKILEWTASPEVALRIAIYLNDKYELDGRDPNGYTGIAWSIGGVHDRPWPERKIFGKIRFMSYNGCKSKFDISQFIKRYLN
jgi:deoxyribodipyrimidine photo-lyase